MTNRVIFEDGDSIKLGGLPSACPWFVVGFIFEISYGPYTTRAGLYEIVRVTTELVKDGDTYYPHSNIFVKQV